MSRYYDILQELLALIRAIVPQDSPDLPFICAEDGRGNILSSDDWLYDPARRTREFDIRGEGGTMPGPGCNLLTSASIRVVYRVAGQNQAFLDCMLRADEQSIANALRNPPGWPSANNVFWPEGTPSEHEPVEDADGKACNVILSIPIVLDYRREI